MNTALKKKERYYVVDWLRGLAVIAMIAYHTVWDLVYIHGVDMPWFASDWAFVIQRSIRWAFVLLSGFCWSMGSRQWKRGLLVIGCGAVVTLVSLVSMPNDPIHYGVLTFLGCAMLLTIPVRKLLQKLNPYVGMALCFVLFVLLEKAELGQIRVFTYTVGQLPQWLFANHFTAFLGFPPRGFVSSDYVPLIPWIFSFWMGLFAYRIVTRWRWEKALRFMRIPPVEWIGRNSLLIYMAHQPLVYGILFVIFCFVK